MRLPSLLPFGLWLLLLCTAYTPVFTQNLYQQVERHVYYCRYPEAEQLAQQTLDQGRASPSRKPTPWPTSAWAWCRPTRHSPSET